MNSKHRNSGRITFRTTPEDHAMLVSAALMAGNKSLNEWMNQVLLHEVERIKSHTNFHGNLYKDDHSSPSERA